MKGSRGCITVPLRIQDNPRRYDHQLVFIDDLGATDAVVAFDTEKLCGPSPLKVNVEAVIVHDIFHHRALGLAYDTPGELLTAYLDRSYPWYDAPRSTNLSEIKGLREDVLAEYGPSYLPTRRDLSRLHRVARARLGYLDPRAYLPRLHKAFTAFLAIKPRGKFATLVVDLDARTVTITPGKTAYAYQPDDPFKLADRRRITQGATR